MTDELVPVRPDIAARAHVDAAKYRAMYQHASRAPETFWADQAKRLEWIQIPHQDQGHQLQGRCVDQVVRGRRSECLGVLP